MAKFFDKEETLTPGERQAYLEKKLRATISNAYKNAPATKSIMYKAGIRPTDIKTLRDLEKLPVTRKPDVIEMQRQNPPYGGFLAIPPEDVERVFLSPGPVYEPLHTDSIKWFARAFWAAGFRKGDIVVNTFTYHMSPAGILFHEAIRDCGATAVPMGTGHTEVQVKTMYDLKATGFVGTPSFLLTVIRQAEAEGRDFRKDFSINRAWFTGEILTPSMRDTFENEYGIDTYQAYAVTEPGGALAYECSRKKGMHLMNDYVVEVIDPENGKQLKAGEVGEVAVTPIHNNSWGLIRFGTGDLSSFTEESCPCGRTAPKLLGIMGRIGDSVKVRGMFVVSRQASSVFGGFPEISRFQIVVNRPTQRDEMTFRIELADETADRDRLSEALNKKFQSVCLVKADAFEFLTPGTIGEDEKPLIDERSWK